MSVLPARNGFPWTYNEDRVLLQKIRQSDPSCLPTAQALAALHKRTEGAIRARVTFYLGLPTNSVNMTNACLIHKIKEEPAGFSSLVLSRLYGGSCKVTPDNQVPAVNNDCAAPDPYTNKFFVLASLKEGGLSLVQNGNTDRTAVKAEAEKRAFEFPHNKYYILEATECVTAGPVKSEVLTRAPKRTKKVKK